MKVRSLLATTPPQSSLDYFLLAEVERHADRLEAAERLYARTVEVDPDHFQALYSLAWCALMLQRPGAALVEIFSVHRTAVRLRRQLRGT